MFSIVGPLTIIGGLLLAVGSAKQRLTTLEEWKRKTEDRISALEKWSWKTKGRDMESGIVRARSHSESGME